MFLRWNEKEHNLFVRLKRISSGRMNYSVKEIYVINCTTLHHVPIGKMYQLEIFVYFGLTILFAVVTMFLNLLMNIATLAKSKKLQSDILLINLSWADFMSGVSLPIWSLNFIFAQQKVQYCILYITSVALVYATGYGCVSFSFMMVFERYLSIFKPFKYEKVMNTRYKHINLFFIFCVLVWLTLFFLIITPYFNKSFEYLKPCIAAFLPVSIAMIFFMNIRIYFHVRKLRTTIKCQGENFAQQTQWICSNQKLLTVLLAVGTSLILCYIPYLVLELHGSFSGKGKSSRMEVLYLWGAFLATCKSLINPCLYIYSLKQIRTSIVRVLSFNEKRSRTLERKDNSVRDPHLQTDL